MERDTGAPPRSGTSLLSTFSAKMVHVPNIRSTCERDSDLRDPLRLRYLRQRLRASGAIGDRTAPARLRSVGCDEQAAVLQICVQAEWSAVRAVALLVLSDEPHVSAGVADVVDDHEAVETDADPAVDLPVGPSRRPPRHKAMLDRQRSCNPLHGMRGNRVRSAFKASIWAKRHAAVGKQLHRGVMARNWCGGVLRPTSEVR